MNPPSSESSSPALARTMGLSALVIYGIGDMLGSGIYALIGKAAGAMGNAIWLAFLASMAGAILTGLSYASLGSRYPRAAGAAYVSYRAFRLPFLSYLIGLAVMASGLTSFATQTRAFSGYFTGMVPGAPVLLVILGFVLLLTFINFWGMKESTWLNVVCTTVEVTGLAIVILVGMRYLGGVNYFETPVVNGSHAALTLPLVLQGAVLTFYSFIGFEDMINVVEEVKDPVRTFPKAVMLALAGVTVIYIMVSVTAISVVPHAELAASKEPLVEVVRRAAPGFPTALFSAISLFAITNTALLNFIMGSRLIYGMSRQGLLPRALGAVHSVRRTPHVAILTLLGLVLVLVSLGDVSRLARSTSVLLLTVFIGVNLSLIVVKNKPGEPRGAFEVPMWVPAGGILVCLAMLLNAKWEELRLALFLLGGITVLYFAARPREITEDTLAEVSDEIEEQISDELDEDKK
jgi:basic amino acid/polyamine antiporter, APA family